VIFRPENLRNGVNLIDGWKFIRSQGKILSGMINFMFWATPVLWIACYSYISLDSAFMWSMALCYYTFITVLLIDIIIIQLVTLVATTWERMPRGLRKCRTVSPSLESGHLHLKLKVLVSVPKVIKCTYNHGKVVFQRGKLQQVSWNSFCSEKNSSFVLFRTRG